MPFSLIYARPEDRRLNRRSITVEVDEDGELVSFEQHLGEDGEPLTDAQVARMLDAVVLVAIQVRDVDHLQSGDGST